MVIDRNALRNRARDDLIQSTRFMPVAWNRVCTHELELDSIRDYLRRLTLPSSWGSVSSDDVRHLKTVCRCCIRLLPDWYLLVAGVTDACFSFPDSVVRGLLWRATMFALQFDDIHKTGIADSIKQRIAWHLEANGEFELVMVEGFLATLASEQVAADVGLV